ncbi:MAG: glycosyl hydrolase [Acidobacteriota bacterium]
MLLFASSRVASPARSPLRRLTAGLPLFSLLCLGSLAGAVAGAQTGETPQLSTVLPKPGTPEATEASRPAPSGPGDAALREAAWQRHRELDETSMFRGLAWRNIGPVEQGGRVVDLAPIYAEPGRLEEGSFLAAYATGSLWRTRDHGSTFEAIFDDQQTTVLGDIATDPTNPNRIWVGTGENNSSRSSYGGVGVFRSDDAGETWTHVGLEASDRIGRIIVDPRDGDRVYVAVLGRLYTPGGPRGVFRTLDGGDTWEHVLDTSSESPWTGVIDLVLDPKTPEVLYAASWHRERRPWDFVEGGEGSGIWKSVDAGTTWTRLGGGLPSGEHVGRIGLAVFPENPQILYASIDNQEPLPESEWDLGDAAVTPKRLRTMSREEFLRQDPEAIEDFVRGNDLDTALDAETLIEMVRENELTLEDLLAEIDDANASLFETDIRGLEIYRSDDGGATWRRTHDEPVRDVVYTYGYYFGEIRVDPRDADRVYAMGVPIIRSEDGGATWQSIQDPEVHVDYHAMWIDPERPSRLLVGNDGGLDLSDDYGETWRKLDAEPVGQFYTVAVDLDEPYNVYGGLQDNGTWKGSSRSRPGREAWTPIGGGDGMYIAVDPRDGTTYIGFQFGFYTRIDPDGTRHTVRPRDALGEPALRYNWSTPIALSHHTPEILYFGADRFYRSTDRGMTWTATSADLTMSDERGNVPFGTITTFSESPDRFGLVWIGTDDGQVHLTDDGGSEWREVDASLPRDRWVSRVEASHHMVERAYVSLNGYRDDDPTPYLYVTEDFGATWRSLAEGLPAEPINVVREDPVQPNVLYVGTDRGAYVSLDRGESWQGLPNGLPNVPVHDLVVHPTARELVAGTHGRSIFVLDVLPIQEMAAQLSDGGETVDVAVYPLESVQFQRWWRGRRSLWFDDPEDHPRVEIPFSTAEGGPAVLRVLDTDNRELQRLEQEVPPGVSTFTWDLLLDEEKALAAERARRAQEQEEATDASDGKDDASRAEEGILAKTPWAEAVRLEWPLYITPGTYTIEIAVGDARAETELDVDAPSARTPRLPAEPSIRGEDDD